MDYTKEKIESIKKQAFKAHFNQLESYCKNDKLCFLFYRLIQADYGFYKHCLHILEAHIGMYFKSCIILPRGSFVSKTGLKETIDLDVDLVLPREFLSPEETTPEEFYRFLKEFNQMILQDDDKDHQNQNEIHKIKNLYLTKDHIRSMEYKMIIEDIPIYIDLFPKLISKDGLLASVGHSSSIKNNNNNVREWTYSEFNQIININTSMNDNDDISINDDINEIIFDDEQTASILFIKLFKKDKKEKSLKDSYIYLLKGYHISLALINVIKRYHQPLHFNTTTKTNCNKIFKRERVLDYIILIIEYLEIGYKMVSLDDIFPINGYYLYNFKYFDEYPFIDDFKSVSQDDRLKLLKTLSKLKEKIKNIKTISDNSNNNLNKISPDN